MKMSTNVVWFAVNGIKMNVLHLTPNNVALKISDDEGNLDYENCTVFIRSNDENKLIAAVKAFNKAWSETE